MLNLDAKKTPWWSFDLQEGILPFGRWPPHGNRSGRTRCAPGAKMPRRFGTGGDGSRRLVGADFAEALKQPVDAQAPAHALPDNWWTYPSTLGKQDSDIEVTKRQWGAFYGTDLEMQLRRRGIDTIILCGISTNIA
ncbi:Isochorismatase family protein yecD [Kluyvera cryocrescens]|uniref:Isochorismatase family protein yecD n=1 Tax=Kluyvera cryocrescens TaxID=580 RepID=A0A485AMS6_KLUCR|nr:Isochorismatase family protein yecD [Kluyvera cryocrescens]